MAALKALPSGRVSVPNSVFGSDPAFQRVSAGNVVAVQIQTKKMKKKKSGLVKAETSSYSYVNGHQGDSIFSNSSLTSFPNGHGN